jgi:hypothetical protein
MESICQGFSTDARVGLTLIVLFLATLALAVLCVKLYVDKLQMRDELLGRKHKSPCSKPVSQCGQAQTRKLVSLQRALKLITLRSGI